MAREQRPQRSRNLIDRLAAPREPQQESPPPHPLMGGDPVAWWSGVVLIVALVAAVFWQSRSFEFVNFDDDQYLDSVVRQGLTWPGFVRVWTAGHVGNWHPLTTLSFMLDATLFGDWPGGYHLHNVVLHALAAATFFAVLVRLTGCLGRSLVAAAVFAIHPLRAESVAWVTERKDVLSGLFLATTLWCYAWYAERPGSGRRYALVLASFVCGLLSKSILVTLPVALLALDWWPLRRIAGVCPDRPPSRVPRRTPRQLVVEKLPLLVLAALSAVITVFSVGDPVRPISTLPFAVRASSSVVACGSYVLQLLVPLGLAPHYPYSATGPAAWQVAAGAAFVVAVTAVAWLTRRTWPALLTGWTWYLVTLLPVIGFIPSGIQLIADRYTYVSQLWLVVALIWGLADLAERYRLDKRLGWAAVAVGMLGLTYAGWWQTGRWRTSETLWRHTLAVTRDNAYAHANLASVLAQRGEPVEAAEHNRKALALESDNLIALSNLATLLVDRGGVTEAIRLYRRAVEVNPKFTFGWFNLGNALRRGGDLDGAEEAWRKAAQIDPRMAPAWSNIAGLRVDEGRWDEALEMAERALAADGRFVPALLSLARAQEGAGRADEAIVAYRRVLDLDPTSGLALNNLGSALERRGRLEEAVAVYRRGLKQEPNAALYRYNLAVVLERQGNTVEAATLFQGAAEGFRAAGNKEMAALAAERARKLGAAGATEDPAAASAAPATKSAAPAATAPSP